MFLMDLLLLLFFLIGILLFATYRISTLLWSLFFIAVSLVWFSLGNTIFHFIVFCIALLASLISLFLTIPYTRSIITRIIFKSVQQQNAHVSALEKMSLDAGKAGFESSFFSGRPNWAALRSLPPPTLTKEESEYLDGPIKNFCDSINDWEIRQQKKIPDKIWGFARKYKFSGLRVSPSWGGAGFSFAAQTKILSKVASRSIDASILIELPTSLYPDEIIEEYGTLEQKTYYLPRLANGEEIVSFAVTGEQGSDVGNMPDIGVVEYGDYNGEKTLGIRINFQKRYITLAPKASLIVLAFSLTDPNNILETIVDNSITLALLPANHPGVCNEKRHFPTNLSFPHGPITGNDVFIPLKWVIGGNDGVGLGWKMITQCLFVGRCLALPSISVGTIQSAFRTTSAYAQVRRQFGLSLNTFEGVQESIAKLAMLSYVSESARAVAASLVDSGYRPLAVSAIMKYQITEYAKEAVNHALAVHAGRGICDGPSNYLLSGYLAVPIGTTVEGANIVTRSVITFAQGALQSHPYLRKEIESCENPDEVSGLQSFEQAFGDHISNFVSNASRSFFHALTFSKFADTPSDVPLSVARWYKYLWRYSCSFAFVADFTMLLMGPQLKKQQLLGGRLADILSELYLLSTVLKRYEDDGFPEEDISVVALSMESGLYRIQESFLSIMHNFPSVAARLFIRIIVFPTGAWLTPAKDSLLRKVSTQVSKPGKTRDRLSNSMHISHHPQDVTGRLEVALTAATAADPVYKKMRIATRAGLLKKGTDQAKEALEMNIISKEEAACIHAAEKAAAFAIAVDSFPQKY